VENKLYNYFPIIERPQLKWPQGKRLAFWIGLNVEHYEVDKPSTSIFHPTAGLVPDPLNFSWRDYGTRVGIWRLIKLFDELKIKPSVLLNADVCRHYPQIINAGMARDWCWLLHGKNNSILETNMPPDQEFQFLKAALEAIREAIGVQPQGWLGPALTETFNTPEILGQLGLTYLLDWCCDDQPFSLNVKSNKMISVPYSIELNDVLLFAGKNLSGDDYFQLIKDQFDVLYEESEDNGQVMCLALHPFIIAQPFRIKYLKKVLQYIAQHEAVWFTTSDEIADHYLKNYCQ
jgi:peptidoglycan/xylan/chitin deacetylase (PgdA/CDA1 family)